MSDSYGASRRPRPRIESLTDLIFGLALSIGAVGTLNSKPTTVGDLVQSVALFAFSFLILISIWLRYTEVMSVLPVETPRSRRLNIVLLFFVSLEPYLYNLFPLSASFPLDVSTSAYALDIGCIYGILASFNNLLTSKDQGYVDADGRPTRRLIRDLQIVVSAMFFISAFPIFSVTLAPNIPVRYLWWLASFFFIRGTRIWSRAGKTRTNAKPGLSSP